MTHALHSDPAYREKQRQTARANSPHSDAMIERARALWDRGLSFRHIAAKLHVTPGVIAGLSHRYGFSHRDSPLSRRWSAQELATLRDLVEAGLTHPEIAAQMPGRSRDAVRHMAREIGLARGSRHAWHHTDAARSAMSAARKREWQNPEIRARRLSAIAAAKARSKVS